LSDLLSQLQAALADRHRIERELGRGGMATVFLAQDLKHDRPVALKVLHPALSAALGPERFLREIRIAAQLQHPHILTLIDSGEAASAEGPGGPAPLLYYAMPYVDGESLRRRLTREGRLSPADTVRILQDVLDALAYAHRQGIVHRDIKPENIMLSGRHALVVDFGVAKAIAEGNRPDGPDGRRDLQVLTTLGVAVGTPAYMAPEQAAGQTEVDGRTDLYAVGLLGYEMLTGRPPFTGTTPQAIIAAQISRPAAPLSAFRPELPAPLAAAIMRCLEKDPAKRWQSAEELLRELESFSTPAGGTAASAAERAGAVGRGRRWLIAAGVLAVLFGAWLWTGPLRRARDRAWTRDQAIPRLLTLAESAEWEQAYTLARTVDRRVPGDSLFNALLPKFAQRYRIHTAPTGAEVWRKAYDAPDSAWQLLGRTPLDGVLVALSGPGGLFLDANRIRIQALGYRTLELVGLPFGDSVIRLDRDSAIPPEMVRVRGGALTAQYPGFETAAPIPLADYLIDRFEITNRDYKQFVDSGGYKRKEFWNEPIEQDGRAIPWERAMARMTDRTGRTGPSTWEAGEYPSGKANDPVGGVSWYEAMAYARFAGKSLPTVIHWSRAASVRNSSWIVPASNFSGQGAVPVGSTRGISAFGAYDMAGNVREWCLNASGTDRYILGGGYDDPPYRFNDSYAQAPFNRSPLNGIRLVRYPPSDSNVAQAAAPLTRKLRDFLHVKPASDAVFAAYRQMFEYDRKPLNARVLETVDEEDWTRELVRLDAAYSGDSLLLYLYLPKRGTRPFPTIVFFPPGGAVSFPALSSADTRHFDYLVKSGRAVLYPVYKGTYQRQDSLRSDSQDSTNFYRDHVVMWGKDLRRGIDYLETRPEVTTKMLAYYGISWGGEMGGLMPAIEPRLTVSVLQVAGLGSAPVRPEVDPVNYLPRIKIPTLMINGRYDFYFPIATSQLPMFRLLGTPPDQKRHVIEEGSHFVPRVRLIQETLAWLDKYQPVGP
jgi:formylglycine-generating enzyme required for sulfatase activity/pimeloyl-ACP methyl ester carboxylesterase